MTSDYELQGRPIEMAPPIVGADVDARSREVLFALFASVGVSRAEVIEWMQEVERQLIDGDGTGDFDGLPIH